MFDYSAAKGHLLGFSLHPHRQIGGCKAPLSAPRGVLRAACGVLRVACGVLRAASDVLHSAVAR